MAQDPRTDPAPAAGGEQAQVKHDAMRNAALNTLPEQATALANTRKTITDNQVPVKDFSERGADAAASHARNNDAFAQQFTAALRDLMQIARGVMETDDKFREHDNQMTTKQEHLHAQVIENDPNNPNDLPAGYQPSATIINDGRDIRITPRDRSWPETIIPNTVGAKKGFGMGDDNLDLSDPGHTYSIDTPTMIPFEEGRTIASEELAKNPTPGPDQTATPQGVRNNALDILPGQGKVTDGSVYSYVVPSSDPTKYTDTIVNYTHSDHLLDPGWVMRRGMRAEDGTMVLQTMGEGAGWWQHNAGSVVWRPINEGVWQANQGQIYWSIVNRMGLDDEYLENLKEEIPL